MPAEVEHLTYANFADRSKLTGVPWWGTGTSEKETQVADRWLTADEVKLEIGFDVDVKPVFRQADDDIYRALKQAAYEAALADDRSKFESVLSGLYSPLGDAQETVRLDRELDLVTGLALPRSTHIATVGSDYTPYPGAELVDYGLEIVDQIDAPFDTAGRLRGDRIIFATIRLDVLHEDGFLVDFDNSSYYNWLLLSTSHDGSMALQAAIVRHRTVCKNTFDAGLGSAQSVFKIRHTADISGRAREAARVLGLVTKADAEFERVAHQLADTSFELEEYEKLAQHLFPITNDMGDLAKKNRNQARDGAKSVWTTTPNITEDLRFTKWGVLNGVTEWAEHSRPVRKVGVAAERKLLSTCFGGPIQKVRERTQEYLVRKAA